MHAFSDMEQLLLCWHSGRIPGTDLEIPNLSPSPECPYVTDPK